VGVEISLMFPVIALAMCKLLPEDPRKKIWGVNNRLFLAGVNAALISFIEIFLAKTPAFVWLYPWWGAVPVFVTVYIPFFCAAFFCYDWKPATRRRFLLTLLLVSVNLNRPLPLFPLASESLVPARHSLFQPGGRLLGHDEPESDVNDDPPSAEEGAQDEGEP
jgi:hypothetical protein